MKQNVRVTKVGTIDYNQNLTPHFQLKEFRCHCGCEIPNELIVNIQHLAENLEALRQYLMDMHYTSTPIHVLSGYRCPEHNAKVNGKPHSQHLLGKAADITIPSFKPIEVFTIIDNLVTKRVMQPGGLGLYPNFVHTDIRGHIVYWNETNEKINVNASETHTE